MDPGDLGSALALRRLAGDRRTGEKGIEADRGQCRFPAVDVGEPSPGTRKPYPFAGSYHLTVAEMRVPPPGPETG